MKYFTNNSNDVVYVYDDSIQSQVNHMNQRVIDENLTEITAEEAHILNLKIYDTLFPPKPKPTIEDLQLQLEALTAQINELVKNQK